MAFLISRRILKSSWLQQTQRRYGYIVLVPEIGEDLPDKNPLLQDDGLLQFNNVTIENCMAAIGKQTLEFEADVKRIEEHISKEKDVDVFKDVIDPLEKLSSSLDTTWGLSKTLYIGNSTLMPTKSYLSIHDRAKRARAAKYNSILIHKTVSQALQTKEFNNEEKRVLQKFSLEGKLNGLSLDLHTKAKLDLNLNKQLVERHNFKIKVDHVTKKFNYHVTDSQVLRDLPDSLVESMESSSTGPHVLTLQQHHVSGFMEYCPVREMRWNVWHALNSRGSGYAEKEFETSTHIEQLRFLRREQARILGFNNFAEMSMQTKMAGSVENVKNTIHALLEQAKPAQEEELQSLYEFAVQSGFEGSNIEMWDLDYWLRKQRKVLYDYNEKLKEYFPLPKVLEGLFEISEKLFNIKIRHRSNISTWHKDVRFYDVFESHSSAPIAGFYLDPYARDDDKLHPRQNNGWVVGIRSNSRIAATKPLAALVFNFTPATSDVPSLLSFKDLQILFHKFGQALQHLLSRTKYSEVSGLSNVEWDAVDVSGYVLSSWLLNKSTIDTISSHYLSEDKVPSNLFDSLISVHKHAAGTYLCKELYLSSLDLEIYTSKDFWLDIMKRLWPEYCCFQLEKSNSHVTSFSQIFYEEWAAAYYSQIWSRMIAADVYSAFHEVQGNEEQIIDVGKRYRDTFLSLGGSCHPNQVFRNFRGRDPSPRALLASLGLKKTKSE